MQFIQRLRMGGLLSFPPDMDFFELQPLNVLIGPNASGKTNFIEVLNSCVPRRRTSLQQSGMGVGLRSGYGKGITHRPLRTIEVEINLFLYDQPLKYRLSFTTIGHQVNIIDEAIEDQTTQELNHTSTTYFNKGTRRSRFV